MAFRNMLPCSFSEVGASAAFERTLFPSVMQRSICGAQGRDC